MNNGWICLHRRLLNNPRYKDHEWLTVWIYLLLNATHKPMKAVFRGEIITLKPGQLITGRMSISHNVGVNESKVKRVLSMLKSEHQIDQQTSNVNSLITILNWEQYQENDQPIAQPVTSQCPASDQPVTTNNNVTSKQENTHTVAARSVYAEIPSLTEVDMEAQKIGIAPWWAKRWFNEMESVGWVDKDRREIRKWRYVLMNEKTKWERAGKPINPPEYQSSFKLNGKTHTKEIEETIPWKML